MATLSLQADVRYLRALSKDTVQWVPWLAFSRTLAPGWGVVVPAPDPDAPPEALFIIPIREVYIVQNTAILRRVGSATPLPARNFNLKLEVGSWVWGFDASLPATALADVEPVAGEPVELEAIVNGTSFVLLVERISRDRTFAKSTISISGRGRAARLDAPYAPVLNFSAPSPRTAQQLAEEALSATEEGLLWGIDWQAVDWTIPGGLWAHNGTQIGALNAIAASAGSYLQPHPTDFTISVLPRYPAKPWEWGDVLPDYELPADVVTREGIEWTDKPRYNRVYVSGVAGGVLGRVTRAGTAGDLAAQMVTDPLIVTAAAAEQRGMPILADTGRIAMVSLRLPVFSDSGPILPGKFVRYLDGDITRIGLARSISLSVDMPNIWQTIGVETHVDP